VAQSLEQFLAIPPDPQFFHVWPLLPRQGKLFIGAEAKSLKSMLALNMAYELAEGLPVLGCFKTSGEKRVLVIEQEIGQQRLQERLRKIHSQRGGVKVSDNLWVVSKDLGARLDTQEGLFRRNDAKDKDKDHPSVVVPNKPDDSELWRRVSAASAEERMPPAEFGKQLTDHERQLFRRWIEQGAPWEGHWAFQPIGRPQPPPVDAARSALRQNDIDNFILNSLDEHGLSPAPEADRATLLRRLRFDLTGLPPSVAELDEFLADTSPQAQKP